MKGLHQAGDEVLRVVSRVLAKHVRKVDETFRFGGEEFVIILPDADAEISASIAERVRAAIETTDVKMDETKIGNVTISLGFAVLSGETDTPETLLKRADAALYEAKETGRNRVIFGKV